MRRLIGAFSIAAVLVAVLAAPAGAAPRGAAAIPAPHPGPARLVATINGGGTATMDDGMGPSAWGAGVKLFSDGSASGQFDCVDQHGAAPGYPGNIWGPVNRWSLDTEGQIVLHIVDGKFHPIPGGKGLLLRGVPFDIAIQRFGGAGVGHWTLSGPFGPGGQWITVCFETVRSGQIVLRLA
jgi:hypothetical protein